MAEQKPGLRIPYLTSDMWKRKVKESPIRLSLYNRFRSLALSHDWYTQATIGTLKDELLVPAGFEEVADGPN